MNIILTEELFRVTYDEGGWMKLMRQTYTDSPPFFWVTESHLCYDLSVDSSSHDLQLLIDYYNRRIANRQATLDSLPQNEIEVIKIYKHHLEITQQFLKKISNYRDTVNGIQSK